ncbi:MAG: hypothetical protein KBS72_04990 [Bacteroidales bacterium]|nr:hypothetical protein [Candidatus Cacconaster scatequi]
MPEDGGTKASTEAIIRVKWEQNDEVSVVNATTGKILGGCLKATESGENVVFSGTVEGTINNNDVLYYVYPRIAQNEGEIAFDQGGWDVSLANQTYDGLNANKVCFFGFAKDQASSTSTSTAISRHIKFTLVTSYAHLNMSNLPAAGFNLSSIDISNVNKGFTWSLSDNTLSTIAYGENEGISVNCTNTKITKAGNAVVRFAIPASSESSVARVVTVNKAYTNDKYVKDELKSSAYYNQLYTSWKSNVSVSSESDKTKVTVTSDGSTDVAEGVIPVADAFVADKNTEIGIGGVGTVTFDATATAKIKSNADAEGSMNVFFKVEDVTETKPVQDANLVYEVTMKTVDEQGVEVFSTEKAAGVATVTVPLGEEVESVTSVALVNESGVVIEGGVVPESVHFENGILTFNVNHFSKYAIKYTVKGGEVDYVAQIGSRKYTTLAKAVEAVQSGNTIQLLCDCMEGEGIIVPGGKNFTLDFGGHTYKVTKDLAGSTGTKNQCFQLLKGSTLVFQNGTITTSCAKLGINSYSDLIVKDVTVDMSQTSATGQVACLETCNGSISLQGNTSLVAKEGQIAVLALYWPNGGYGDINVELNTTGEVKGLMAYGSYQVQDVSTVAQHSHVAIKNGKYDVTFDMDNLENYDFKIYGGVFKTNPDTKYLAPNHEVVTNTDSETSASYPHKVQQKPYVAMIGENGYFSLADALVAVKNNETIVMHQNDVLTKGLTITLENNEAFTLDLNGKTVSIAETGFNFTANGTNAALRSGVPLRFAIVVNGNGTMNICDNSTGESGRLETKNNSYGTTKTILVDGNAIVNVNSGTIAADYAPFYVVGFTGTTAVPADAPKPTLNVNGGKIFGQQLGIGIKGNTAILKVTGGEIIGKEYYGVSTNGTQDWYDGGKFAIEITGGSIKSEDGPAMYLPAEGPTVITGGTIEGATGIAVKGGSLSISDNAVVKAFGPFVEAHEVSSGNANTGSAIYVEDTYANHAPFVNISGGKFSSANNKAVEYYTTKADDAADKGKVTLTGGLYSDQPEAFLIGANYEAVSNSDATYKYKVQQKPPVVKIGGVEYATLADAFAAVPTDGTATTVTLLENIGSKVGDGIVWKEYAREFAYTVNANQNITFDLNGKKIYAKTTVNGYTGFLLVKNGGSLTIKDSAGGGELNYLDGNDNNGGLAISSEGNLTIHSGTIENHTNCNASAIQGAIDVHANEWGTSYTHHVTFKMDGGVLKSQNDNTLRIYDSSQTGKGTVVFDFEINGGEIYGADAVFIMTQWTKTYCTGDTYMNNINVNVKGGKFVTKNGIRVVGNVGEDNNKAYKAININVSGGDFTILSSKESKHRVNNVAFQESAGWASTEESTKHLRSYTEVTWTASAPTYSTPTQQ